jgi:hypothetical protein
MANQIESITTSATLRDQCNQPMGSVGKLGRYQVVAKMPEGVSLTDYELGVYAKNVRLLDRIVNYFTGFLTQEKNEAMIDFIRTGTLQAMEDYGRGKTILSDMQGDLLNEQLYIFERMMNGSTQATLEQQRRAIEALKQFLTSEAREDMHETVKEFIQKHVHNEALADALQSLIEVNVSVEVDSWM